MQMIRENSTVKLATNKILSQVPKLKKLQHQKTEFNRRKTEINPSANDSKIVHLKLKFFKIPRVMKILLSTRIDRNCFRELNYNDNYRNADVEKGTCNE